MEYLKREYVKGARQNKKESGIYLKETRKKVGKGLIEEEHQEKQESAGN